MKKIITFGLILLFWAGCTSKPSGPSQPTSLTKTPEMQRAFAQAENAYANGSFLGAESLYRAYVKDFAYNALTPKAYFRLAELRFRDKDYSSSIVLYKKSTEKYLDSDWGSQSLYKQAVCYSKMEKWNQVASLLDDIPWSRVDGKTGVRVGSLRVAAGRGTQSVLQEQKGYLELVDAYEGIDPSEAKTGELNWIVSNNTAHQELADWVGKDSSSPAAESSEVESWVARFDGKISGGYVFWKLARLSYQKGDYARASEWTRRYLNQYPRHEFREAAQNLLIDIEKRGAFQGEQTLDSSLTSNQSIGVLLPLSGKYAVYGESVLHGLECASGIFTPCHHEDGVQLVIRDTQGDPKKAAAFLDEFAKNSSIRAVIGPLPQVEISEAAQAAERNQISMISLSQRSGVAEMGGYVFRNFLTVQDQVMTLVDEVCGREKIKKFGILYPQGETGEEYQKAFKEAVASCGGKVLAVESYPANTRNFTDKVRSLISSSEEMSADVKAPFQALFIPDVYRRVPAVIDALNLLHVKKLKLIGGAGWNNPSLLDGNPEALEGAVFVDGFFTQAQAAATSPGNFIIKDFVSQFQNAYGMDPTILEAYAYDTLNLVSAVLREHPEADRTQVRQFLLDKKNFPGVTGSISFDEEGDARRRLSVLKIENGEIKVVESK